MHGPGFTPPRGRPHSRPHSAVLVLLRVIFVILSLGSLGLLAWGAMLRLACVRRRPLDWLLFVATLALSIGSIAVIGIWGTPAEVAAEQAAPPSAADWVALAVMLGMAIGVPVHYLIAEIAHHQRWRPTPAPTPGWTPPAPARQPYAGTSYGYPPQQYATEPQQYATQRQQHVAQPQPAHPHPYPPHPQQPLMPQPLTHPQIPAPPQQSHVPPLPALTQPPPRIHQVRAELDELSELLRKDRDGEPGGAR